jgi:excisionase family DNA binding protein
MNELLTLSEAADLIAVPRNTLRTMADQGLIQSTVTNGKHRRFTLENVRTLRVSVRKYRKSRQNKSCNENKKCIPFPKRSRPGRKKFSPADLVLIKADRAEGMVLRELQAKWKCSYLTMQRICAGKY